MGTETPQPQNLEEYSAEATVITFDRPVPLLRGPIRADPSAGPYVLAFRDPESWASALKSCRSKIIDQCETGARIGCAINASSKCKPSWWRSLIGQKPTDLKEREKCEEREMEACFATAKDKCVGIAKEKCATPFRDARIAVAASERWMTPKEVKRLICWASSVPDSTWLNLIGLDQLVDFQSGATNYRASELLGSDSNGESTLATECWTR